MRTIILLASLCLLAACSGGAARPDVLERVTGGGAVRIGVKADSPPFGAERGDMRYGFDIDIAEAVARRIGAEPVFVSVTSAERIPRLQSGELDLVVASMTQTRQREQAVDFSVPYFEDGPAIMVPATSGITSYVQLGGKRLGVAKGSTTAASVAQVAPEAVLVELPAIRDLLPALRAGSVDAIASDYLILLGLLHGASDAAAYRIPGGRIVSEPYGIAMPQDQSRLRDAVNRALMEMWEDGEYARIVDTWFGQASGFPAEIRFVLPTIPR